MSSAKNRGFLIGAVLAICVASGYAQIAPSGRAQPHPRAPAQGPQEDMIVRGPDEGVQDRQSLRVPNRSARYDALLIAYLRRIERIEQEQSAARTRQYQQRLDRFRSESEGLRKTRDDVLAALQREIGLRPAKKIDFDGECYENRSGVVVPVSDDSARVFATIYDMNALAVPNLLSKLGENAHTLGNEWRAFVLRLSQDAEKGSPLWRQCVLILYAAGVTRDMYRPALVKMASIDDDLRALETLFFDVDMKTGELVPVITLENLTLMKELSATERAPGIRVCCAHYAVRLNDHSLAETVCSDLLNKLYKGQERRVRAHLMEDMPLVRARHAALCLLFYGLRNEAGFGIVYERSQIRSLPVSSTGASPKGGDNIPFDSYVCAEMEQKYARSLIGEIERFDKETAQ